MMERMLRNLSDTAGVDHQKGELLRKSKQYLLGNKYLIVMDYVRSEYFRWWNLFYRALPKENNGSRIIVTARNENITQNMGVMKPRIHQLKCLCKEDSWLLFQKIAFAATGGTCNNPELEHVGKEIVDMCKGFPLAIKAIGGIMLFKPANYQEWKRIADDFTDKLAERNTPVMASLKLSYDKLPSYLKLCFLCLSIYPKDYVISKDQLIYWWVGEGFFSWQSW